MKRMARLGSMLLLGMVVSVGAVDHGLVGSAEARDGKHRARCSERTIKGTYAFGLQGNIQEIGPIAVSGTTQFDGREEVVIRGFINTTSGSPPIEVTMSGRYEVNGEDCTGFAVFEIPSPGLLGRFTEIRFEAAILNDGEEIRYLITTPGIVFAGSTGRQFPKLHR